MKPPFPASTGLPGLDGVLNGLLLGDNVVWQVDEIEDYRHFAVPFVLNAVREGRRVVYMRFADHPPLIEPSADVKMYSLNAYSGFETFTTEVYTIVTGEGREVFYVFDCLSFLQSVWATDLMTGNYFVVMCP